MRLGSREEIQELEKITIEGREGTPAVSAEKLMRSAGKLIFKILTAEIPSTRIKPGKHRRFIILAGPGHNGGDAFVVARLLERSGYSVVMFAPQYPFAKESEKTFSPTELYLKVRSEVKGPIFPLEEFLSFSVAETDVILDGLFGIGLKRELSKEYAPVIRAINDSAGFKVAIDCPSGLDVNTGEVFGECVRANLTLTIEFPKPGFFLQHGPSACSTIRVLKIGFPEVCMQQIHWKHFCLGLAQAKSFLPARSDWANKSKGGRSLIVAGSEGVQGAAQLAARAAARSGAGYVVCSFASEIPDFLTVSRRPKDLDQVKFDSLILGPGMGLNSESNRLLDYFLERHRYEAFKAVLDADAITLLARRKKVPKLPTNWVLTPHAGELSRILQVPAKEIEANRVLYSKIASQRLGCQVLLKGFHSVLAFADKTLIIPTGNKALAKAGTGDVLAGMAGAFMAQGLSTGKAAALASYLHGMVADSWVSNGHDYLSLMASDVIEGIPFAIAKLRSIAPST